jgi:hypothetical protein
VKSNNDFSGLKELSLFTEQGVFFGIAGKKQRGIANVAGLIGADSTSHSPAPRGRGVRGGGSESFRRGQGTEVVELIRVRCGR